MALQGLKGLTAQDRADWEKVNLKKYAGFSSDQIERIYRNTKFKEKFGNDPNYDSLTKLNEEERDQYYNDIYTKDSLKSVLDYNSQTDNDSSANYDSQNSISDYKDEENINNNDSPLNSESKHKNNEVNQVYGIVATSQYLNLYNSSPRNRDKAIQRTKEIAEVVSPYYRKYKDTEYLPFDDDDWKMIAAEYHAKEDEYGADEANDYLTRLIQNRASMEQSNWEKAWRGFAGMGASAAGETIMTVGMLYGMLKAATGNGQKIEGLNGAGNFFINVLDNEITNYGSDVVEYGSLGKAVQERAKELGISELQVIETMEQQLGEDSFFDQIFNRNTLPIALQSQGFTVASALLSFGASFVNKQLFKAGRKLAKKAAVKAVKKAASKKGVEYTARKEMELANMALRKSLPELKKAEKFVSGYVTAGLVGTVEGAFEGLNTKKSAFESYLEEVNKGHDKALKIEAEKIIKENPLIDENSAYAIADQRLVGKYEESVAQAEYDAAKAGLNNFIVNSGINGIINSTFKAGLQAPRVQGAIRSTRLGRALEYNGTTNISNIDNNFTVRSYYKPAYKIYNAVKEPAGEFLEEYIQNVSDAAATGGGLYNIQAFVENKYNGDGLIAVGDHIAGQGYAYWKAAGEAAISQESFKAGIYGALGSIMGTPWISGGSYTTKYRGSDGKIHTKADFGIREGETNWEHVKRLTPWRSGLISNVQVAKQKEKDLEDFSKAFEEWLNTPENREKFDGAEGTYNFAKLLESSAATNNRFGYKNSALAKLVNDAFMLMKLEGTEHYDAIMANIINTANMELESKEGADYIAMMRKNIHADNNDISDAEIIAEGKKNANKILDIIENIKKESESIEALLGNVNEDTKQSLIFGKLALELWDKDSKEIEDSFKQIPISEEDKGSPNVSDEQMDIIEQYGSVEYLNNELANAKPKIEELEDDIKRLKSKEKRSDKEQQILEEKEEKLKDYKKETKEIETLIAKVGGNGFVLNRQQILSLPADIRAIMLNPGNLNRFSKEQQKVITELVNEAKVQDKEFLNKISDAAKIEQARRNYIEDYNNILSDPESFNVYIQRAKQAAQQVLTKKKYESISNIENYQEFAKELDKIVRTGNQYESLLIRRELQESGNVNYERYARERALLGNLQRQIIQSSEFKDLDDNSKELFLDVIPYIADQGIDVTDENAVVEALLKTDDQGNLLFKKYIDEINEDLEENQRSVFTGIGDIIQTYKDVLHSYQKDEASREANNTPIEVSQTTNEESAPPKPVDTTPVNTSPSTPVNTPEENSLKDQDKESEKNNNDTTDDKIDNDADKAMSDDNSADISKDVEVGLNIIKGSTNAYSDEVKEQATNILNELKEGQYDSKEDFVKAIQDKSKENLSNTPLSSLLDRVANSISKGVEHPNIFDSQKKYGQQNKERTEEDKRRENQNTMHSSNIEVINDLYPESAIANYWKEYDIQGYLYRTPFGKGKHSPKVYFITDANLTAKIKESMGNKYSDADRSLIAVVEDKNGKIVINGKHYQPIATFPSDYKIGHEGVNHISSIRSNIANQEEGQLIKDKNGKVLVGSLEGVTAHFPERIQRGEPNKSLNDLLIEGLSVQEKNELESVERKNQHATTAFQKMKKRFLDSVSFCRERDKNGNKRQYFYLNIKDADGNSHDSRIFYRPISKTIGRNTDKTIIDLFTEGASAEDIITFNSRTIKFNNELDRLFKTIPQDINERTVKEKDGQLIPTGEYEEFLNNLGANLTNKLSNYIGLAKGWVYKAVPGKGGSIDILVTNGKDSFKAVTFDAKSINEGTYNNQFTASFLQNIILDSNNNVRMNFNSEFVKWQIEESHGDETGTSLPIEQQVLKNLVTAFEDGCLEMSLNSLEYVVTGSKVRSPFQSDISTPANTQVTNANNASSNRQSKHNETKNNNGGNIDSDTGSHLSGKESTSTKNPVTAINNSKVEEMKESSNNFELSEDEKFYINKKTGKKYARVTSLIYADETADDPMDDNNPWVLPSTAIGNSIDSIVRDFFADGIYTTDKKGNKVLKHYPNISNAYLQRLEGQLNELKTKVFDPKNLTIVSSGIKVDGEVQVTDSNGRQHSINVAGTLDLLAYDPQGNFYIYDIKTKHAKDPKSSDIEKYNRQLTLYKKLLEDKYGIKVKEIGVIPIVVQYEAPSNAGGKAVYTKDVDGQLFKDGRKFVGSKPNLQNIIENMTPTNLNLLFEKLSDKDKEALSEIITAQIQQENPSVSIDPVRVESAELKENQDLESDNTGDLGITPDAVSNALRRGFRQGSVGSSATNSAISNSNYSKLYKDDENNTLTEKEVYERAISEGINIEETCIEDIANCLGLSLVGL